MLTLRHDSAWWASGSLPLTCSSPPMHFCCHLSKVMQSILRPTHWQQTTYKKLLLWASIKLTNNHLELVYYLFSKVKYFKKKPENNPFLIISLYGYFNKLKSYFIFHENGHFWLANANTLDPPVRSTLDREGRQESIFRVRAFLWFSYKKTLKD